MRQYVVIAILALLGVVYLANYKVLLMIYPLAETDYYEFRKFYYERNKVYEFMFTGFFLVSFLDSKNRLSKSVACFFMTLTCGSFIDKTIFGISKYLWSDLILVLVAFIISIYVYVRENPGHT